MDEKQKKVDTGKALLGSYQREKQEKVSGRSGDYHGCAAESTYDYFNPGKVVLDTKKDKMDLATLHKRTAQFESLTSKIKALEESLSDKDETINALKIEIQVLRKGNGDSITTPENDDSKMICELQKKVDSRDLYIQQLSDSLNQRSEELKQATLREKELTQKLHILQQNLETKAKQYELKISSSFNETIEFKGKAEQLAKQMQDYSDLVLSLRVALESGTKKIDHLQAELDVKSKKLDEYKHQSSGEIKQLMRQVESLNHDLSEKEQEVYAKNKSIQTIQNQMEEKFGKQLVILKKELEKKYAEDVERVEKMYDEMQLKLLRNPVEDNKVIEKCNDLETQISSCKLECEEEIKIYKEELQQLILKSKATEDRLVQDLDRHKIMAEHYRQQVENVENKVAEEVSSIKKECYVVVEKFKADFDGKVINYQQEIDRLSIQLKDYALKEAQAEVEIESYREQLAKYKSDVKSLFDNLNQFKTAYEEQKVTIASLEQELDQYQNIIVQYKTAEQIFKQNENQLLHENSCNKAKIQEYEGIKFEMEQKMKYDSEKYNSVVATFENQLQQLMSELERNKAKYADDISHLNSVTNEQQNEIKNLEAKILYILEKTKSDVEDLEIFNDRSPQMNMIKQQLLSANRIKETNKGFLLSILKGLRKLKTNLKVIIDPDSENFSNETSDVEESKDILSYEELIVEVEKNLCDIQNATQQSLNNANALTNSPGFVPNKQMITSTPHVKGFLGACFNSPSQDTQPDLTNTAQISCDNCQGLVDKCVALETENKKLSTDIASLLFNEKEMEYCLLVATQETASFNQQCQSLDAKIKELEKSKLSDHLIKKENYDLKTKIISLEQTQEKLHQELQKASENYIKLQHMYNNSITTLQNKLVENGPNQELEQCLVDLKQKSEEVIVLKTQITNLQKSEQDCKARAMDIQIKYEQLIAKQQFIESELSKNKEELNKVCQENNLLSSENNVLKTKLKSSAENSNDSKISSGSILGVMHLARQINGSGKDKEPLSSDLSSLSANRLQTMEILASSRNSLHNSVSKTRSSAQSIAEQIEFDLMQLNQYDERLPMPTILEDVEEDSSLMNNEHTQADISLINYKRRCLLENRSKFALKSLLTALFDDYSLTLKKLNLWREEFDTFDYNLIEYLDRSITSCKAKEDQVNLSKDEEREEESSPQAHGHLTKSIGTLNRIVVECVKAMLYLKVRLIAAHEKVMSSIVVSKKQLEEVNLIQALQDRVGVLETEKSELDKKHKSAIELLIKDHETELGLVRNLLSGIQKNSGADDVKSEDVEKIRKDLEQKHSKELEELRTYYEKRCADLVKHYSEEIYSQSQQSCKVSVSSSSSMENIADLYFPGAGDEEEANHQEEVEESHELCNRKVAEFQDLLENMKEKYKNEIESVKSDYELQLTEMTCKACGRNLNNRDDAKPKHSGIPLEQYYTEKIKDLGEKYSSSNITKDLELKVYQIKEEVRKDYEYEIERMREEIIGKELQRKDEEIKLIKTQLNEAHKLEIEKMWRRYEELASKEAENSMVRVKNEVILSQELEDKVKLTEQLQSEKEELLKKLDTLNEERQKEQEELRLDLNQVCRREKENMRQAFEIEIATRVETVMEEKMMMEDKLKREIRMLREELSKIQSDTEDYCQDNQETNFQQLAENVRKEILCLLEQQIKAMVDAGEEERDESDWPLELVSLERVFTASYQQQLSRLVEEHALEMAETKAEYDTKLANLVKEYSLKQVEDMSLAAITNEDEDISAIIRERDSLRCLVLTLRQVVQELTRYLTSCENELNKSFLNAMLNVTSPQKENKVQISELDVATSDSDSEADQPTPKKVHFAPDVSSIVSLMDEDCLFENSADISLHLRSQLEGCLQRLKNEAVSVLGLTQTQNRGLPSSVEDRRLSSVTRQLIEEKKAKEEANNKLSLLQELVDKYEKELNDVHKELIETKDNITKEKVAAETEFNERQAERRTNKLSLLQEKARNLLFGREDCPPQWLNFIEDMFAEGDLLIEEANKTRDELQLEVEAADKQLRSTRAFLEEQATEREQERDEYTREIARLTEQLRERDREWTSHRQFVSEWETPRPTGDSLAATCTVNSNATVDALEQQVRDTAEVLKETEEKNSKLEKELKAANDKIWVLRDIISELEVQVSSRCEREVALERRLAELEAELDTRSKTQADTLSELQALRDSSGDHAHAQQQLSSLHDQLAGQKHNNAYVVRQMKSQLRTIGRSLENQIKELEAVNIHVSSASLSSPSEDVSIREHLEALRCATPEERPRSGGCGGSPPSPLTVEEINQLSEKLLRYSRAAEVLIKTLRDREMEIHILRAQQEELQAERDVIQNQAEKQVLQLASMNNKVEELRRRTEHDVETSVAPLHQHILDLESQITSLNDELREHQRQAGKMKQRLERSEALVQSHEAELSSLSEHQHQLVSKLNQDLAAMRAEKQQLQHMVEKFQHEEIVSFPQLIEVMLAEKNADIDHLQQRVEELSSQREHSGSKNQSKSREGGNRVSFADDVTDSRLAEGERARDGRVEHSSIKPFFSTPLSSIDEGRSRFAPRVVGEDISKIPEPVEVVSSTVPNRATQLDSVLCQLKSELELKNVRLIECEAQLQERAILEQELNKTKEELLETVKSVTEDKIFYEEQLNDLLFTKKLLAEREVELEEVKKELDEREKDIVKTKADVRALQTIMEGLQQKLQEAKTFAKQQDDEVYGNSEMRLENEKLRDECETYKTTLVSLEEQITEVKKALSEEKKTRQDLERVLEELGKSKQEILNDLIKNQSRCEFLQVELDKALSSNEATKRKAEELSEALEEAEKENTSLDTNCKKLRKEIEELSKKQKSNMKNMLRKDSEEALKLKEELVSLKSSNSELHSQCESLQQELSDVGNNLDLLKEINQKQERISKLEAELKGLENNNQTLKEEKSKTEQSLSLEISGLRSLIGDLSKETESKNSEECLQNREHKDTNLVKKYDILKREYERQRRARRESEKKYVGLKTELAKEKRFTAELQNLISEKKMHNLEVSKAEIVDIRSESLQPAGSLDNLADQVQQELNASAQLDQSLISGLQSSEGSEAGSGRSDKLPLRVEHLTARLAEMETALHVEKTVMSELRAKVIKEHRLYVEARTQAEQYKQEVVTLQMLNDQLEDKFKSIANQLQEQVNEVKELRVNLEPVDSNTPEKQKLKKLAAENQRRVDELVKEREFNKNQLLYLREELSKMWAERERSKESDKVQRRDSSALTLELNQLQLSLEMKTRELEAERRKCKSMERLLQQANQTTDKQNHQLAGSSVQFNELCLKIEELNQKLAHETGLRRALEAKIHTIELSEKNRHIRRKALESKLKDQLAESEKIKKDLERECLSLQLKLKHSNLQLTAHTAESPLSLRLNETNLVIERLVKEKEDLCSENLILKEEKRELLSKARGQASLVEDLKSQIRALNIRVVDGGMDNLNAMFAAERAAWLREKHELKHALAQKYTASGESFNSFNNAAQILQRYLKAESHRKALVWQKRYLLVSLRGYQDEEKHTIAVLSQVHPFAPVKPPTTRTPGQRFKAAVSAIRSVSRLRFLVNHRKRMYENTVQTIRHAINNNVYPRKVNHVPELQTLWRRTQVGPSTSSLQPGNMGQLLDQFNTIQDRIKNSLTSTT